MFAVIKQYFRKGMENELLTKPVCLKAWRVKDLISIYSTFKNQ